MDRSIKGERKRDMKKRWVILLSNILSIILIAISLSGCKMFQSRDPWKKKQIDGEFYYYVKNESAIILGLVDEEKEREELVIPKTLGGYPVKQIGEAFTASVGSRTKHYGIDATNIDRIIINNEIYLWNYGIENFSGDLILYEKVKFMNGHILPSIKSVHINFNIGDQVVEIQKDLGLLWYNDSNTVRGVIFKSKYGELATFVTILVSDKKLTMPQSLKADDFTFGGWYVDEKYEREWNFETDEVTEAITLYAKWIEV